MSDSADIGPGGAGRRPGPECRLDLSRTAHPVAAARELVRGALASWRVGDPADEDILLVVCELVANATMHAGGPLGLDLRHTGRAIRVEVTDASPVVPTPQPARPGHPGGHGLMIVQRLSHRWGSEQRPDGKTVWAEISTASPDGRYRGHGIPGQPLGTMDGSPSASPHHP